MLGQSIFGKLFGFIWVLIVFTIVVRFGEPLLFWFLNNITTSTAWAGLIFVIGLLWFTGKGVLQAIFGGLFSAVGSAGVDMTGSRTENGYFMGRAPMLIPAGPKRLPLTESDDPYSQNLRIIRDARENEKETT